MNRLVISISLCLALFVSACGYHLAGMGRGAVPEDVQAIRIVGSAQTSASFLRAWRGFVHDHATGYSVISADSEQQTDVEMRIGNLHESIAPISFDASGIATLDRMTLSGALSLWRADERIWTSGFISAYEDVDVSGGPTAIESAKARIRSDLEAEWMRQAWLKFSSGF
ncbi:MAG: hypothetical protein R8K53_09825 [Mariprofundaceae bacterium]